MRRFLGLSTALAGFLAVQCVLAAAPAWAEGDATPPVSPPAVTAPAPAPVPAPEPASPPSATGTTSDAGPATGEPAPPAPPPPAAPAVSAEELLRKAGELRERREFAAALDLLKQAAEAGSTEAIARVGDAYSRGVGVARDDAESLRWYRRAAELGNANAMNHVGYAIDHGIGTSPADQAEALKWYRRAADLDDPGGLNNLGYALSNGRGVAQDMAEALRLYRRAADLGSTAAMFNLGDAYDTGRGVARDDATALGWYRKSADLGNPLAMNYVGQAYENSKGVAQDWPESVVWYRKGADLGNALAMSNLGYAYAHGRGVERDDAQALIWYRKAADLGDNAAAVGAGDAYLNGLGVEADDQSALRYYRMAADRGDKVGMFDVGRMYREGRGTAADAVQAMRWFRRASEAGYAAATKAIYEMQTGETLETPPPPKSPRKPTLAAPVTPPPALPVAPPVAQPPAAPSASSRSVAADDETALNLTRPVRLVVQQGLSALGFAPGDLRDGPDGEFTPRVRQAISAYQRRLGFNPSGYLTADLLQRLIEDVKAQRVQDIGIRPGGGDDAAPRRPSGRGQRSGDAATPPRVAPPSVTSLPPVTAPAPGPVPRYYADERRDFGVAPRDELRREVGSPTPTTIPGALVLTTQALIHALNDTAPPRYKLIDVLDGGPHRSIVGAVRMPLAGRPGSFDDLTQRAVATQLRDVTAGQLDVPLVFLCAGARCWESYNAALRALHAGYRNVYWYRGGLEAWTAAGQPVGAAAGAPETVL